MKFANPVLKQACKRFNCCRFYTKLIGSLTLFTSCCENKYQ